MGDKQADDIWKKIFELSVGKKYHEHRIKRIKELSLSESTPYSSHCDEWVHQKAISTKQIGLLHSLHIHCSSATAVLISPVNNEHFHILIPQKSFQPFHKLGLHSSGPLPNAEWVGGIYADYVKLCRRTKGVFPSAHTQNHSTKKGKQKIVAKEPENQVDSTKEPIVQKTEFITGGTCLFCGNRTVLKNVVNGEIVPLIRTRGRQRVAQTPGQWVLGSLNPPLPRHSSSPEPSSSSSPASAHPAPQFSEEIVGHKWLSAADYEFSPVSGEKKKREEQFYTAETAVVGDYHRALAMNVMWAARRYLRPAGVVLFHIPTTAYLFTLLPAMASAEARAALRRHFAVQQETLVRLFPPAFPLKIYQPDPQVVLLVALAALHIRSSRHQPPALILERAEYLSLYVALFTAAAYSAEGVFAADRLDRLWCLNIDDFSERGLFINLKHLSGVLASLSSLSSLLSPSLDCFYQTAVDLVSEVYQADPLTLQPSALSAVYSRIHTTFHFLSLRRTFTLVGLFSVIPLSRELYRAWQHTPPFASPSPSSLSRPEQWLGMLERLSISSSPDVDSGGEEKKEERDQQRRDDEEEEENDGGGGDVFEDHVFLDTQQTRPYLHGGVGLIPTPGE